MNISHELFAPWNGQKECEQVSECEINDIYERIPYALIHCTIFINVKGDGTTINGRFCTCNTDKMLVGYNCSQATDQSLIEGWLAIPTLILGLFILIYTIVKLFKARMVVDRNKAPFQTTIFALVSIAGNFHWTLNMFLVQTGMIPIRNTSQVYFSVQITGSFGIITFMWLTLVWREAFVINKKNENKKLKLRRNLLKLFAFFNILVLGIATFAYRIADMLPIIYLIYIGILVFLFINTGKVLVKGLAPAEHECSATTQSTNGGHSNLLFLRTQTKKLLTRSAIIFCGISISIVGYVAFSQKKTTRVLNPFWPILSISILRGLVMLILFCTINYSLAIMSQEMKMKAKTKIISTSKQSNAKVGPTVDTSSIIN